MARSSTDKVIENIERFKKGDRQAFEELYELTHNRVYFLASNILHNHENAMEVVQETFISVYKSLEKLNKPEVFNAWLSKIVLNKCRDLLSKNKDVLFLDSENWDSNEIIKNIEDTSGDFIPHDVLDKSETRNMIMSLIDNLPNAQRTTLLLHYYQGLKVEEIAAIMECPVATVKSRLIYARRQIKVGVEGYEQQGVKLYNVATVPMIIYILKAFAKENALGAETATKLLLNVNAVIQTVAAGATQTGAATVSSAGVTTKVQLLHKFAALSLRTKVIIGIVAGALTISAITIPFTANLNKSLLAGSGFLSIVNDTNIVGNIPGNIENSGIAAIQGKWIYYISNGKVDSLYKIRTDGTGVTKLDSNEDMFYLNVVGDWIYYGTAINNGGSFALYKIRTDGTQKTKLNDDMPGDLAVEGDWIYFSSSKDNLKPYKMRTDGTYKTKLTNDSTHYINVKGEWVYYSKGRDGRDDWNIYKIRVDGTERTRLNNDISTEVNVNGDWIYYINGNDNSSCYKIRTDGSNRTRIINENITDMIVAGNWIYFTLSNGDGTTRKLYKIRTDGTNKVEIINENLTNYNVVGEWIYYLNASENYSLYKVKTDGSNKQSVPN